MFFKPRMEAGREDFACQDSGLSQIFKLIVSSREKTLNNINVVAREDRLNRKTAHSWVLSVAQKRCILRLLNVFQSTSCM